MSGRVVIVFNMKYDQFHRHAFTCSEFSGNVFFFLRYLTLYYKIGFVLDDLVWQCIDGKGHIFSKTSKQLYNKYSLCAKTYSKLITHIDLFDSPNNPNEGTTIITSILVIEIDAQRFVLVYLLLFVPSIVNIQITFE